MYVYMYNVYIIMIIRVWNNDVSIRVWNTDMFICMVGSFILS